MSEDKAPVSKEKKVKTKEKAKRSGKKHSSLKIWEYYEVKEGSAVRKRDPCPRCGPGTFLSKHKNRLYCGRCGFAQFEKGQAKAEEPRERPKPEEEAKPAEAMEEPTESVETSDEEEKKSKEE